MCGSMVDIQCLTTEIRQGNKKDRKKKPQDENIYVRILLCRAAINYLVCLHSRTSKSRSKRDKKRWSLKEGSPYEEFALVEALRNLVEQTASWKGMFDYFF